MFLVRAVDAVVQRVVFRRSGGDEESSPREGEERKRWRQRVTMRIDAMLFWASSARFVYVATHILPRTLASSKCMYSAYLCSSSIKNHVVLLLRARKVVHFPMLRSKYAEMCVSARPTRLPRSYVKW